MWKVLKHSGCLAEVHGPFSAIRKGSRAISESFHWGLIVTEPDSQAGQGTAPAADMLIAEQVNSAPCCCVAIWPTVHELGWFPSEFRVRDGAVVGNLSANAGSIPGRGGSHMPRSSWARAPQLLSLCSRACKPQLRSPRTTTTEACML